MQKNENSFYDIRELINETNLLLQKSIVDFNRQSEAFNQKFEIMRLEREKESRNRDKEIRKLEKQISNIGKKFGSFTEGMAFSSMERILTKQFHVENISVNVKVRKNGEEIEIDVLGYSNEDINAAYIVEVKSHLDNRAIKQLLKTLNKFPKLCPEHKDKKLFGIIADVQIDKDVGKKVLESGLYLAKIKDDTFRLQVPKGFQAKSYN